MDFGLSEEQRLLEDTVRRYLDESVPIARAREIAGRAGDGHAGDGRALWGELAGLGVAGVLIPERYGGSGLGLLDAAIVAESLGWGATPAPFLASAVLAPVALVAAGSEAQREAWLPRIATGDARVGAALTEVFARREDAGVRLERGALHGKALFVLDAEGADALLVAAGPDDLLLVESGAPGLTLEPLTTLDRTRRVAEASFDGVAPAEALGGPGGAGRAVGRALDAGRLVLAADALGAAERMLERAVAYAGERRQFGRVIGSFQAVKHLCAEMAAELEPARALLWYAAHAFDALPDEAPALAAHAKAHLAEVATAVAKTATEVHGGIGFTDEENLHVWFKRIGLDRQLLGGPERLRERAAELQGWTAA